MQHTIHERSWVEIDLAAFRQNLVFLKSFLQPGQDFLQIVKADAYGHGAKEIAEAALAEGAVYLGVANSEEGKLLRIQGIDARILILSPSLPEEIDEIIKYDLDPAVSDIVFAKNLAESARIAETDVRIHLKIDTGMHRSGIRLEDALNLYHEITGLHNLVVEGVFSHFSSAESDSIFSSLQEEQFAALIAKLPEKPRYIHLSNSAGTIGGFGKICNLARFGIFSFGVDTVGGYSARLAPAMSFKSTLSQVKTVLAGESVGYNRDWRAPKDGKYGILPIGYADGYDFLLSNKGKVLVQNNICQVIGRVSMDMITIDLSEVPNARVGDIVTLLGANEPELRAEALAGIYQGSPYELLCQVGRRARRYYKSRDHILHSAPIARRDFIAADFGNSKLNQIISSALAKRLESAEIGDLIYKEILRSFFFNKDRDVHYRRSFAHEISFSTMNNAAFYQAKTRLSYRKILGNNYFVVACATSDESLRRYFMRTDVEYRWLLDAALDPGSEHFKVDSVKINGFELFTQMNLSEDSLEIRCSHPKLDALIGTEVEFEISTTTLYPKNSHQLSVFISELTQGVQISFLFPEELSHVEPVRIFSGQEKNPPIIREENRITLKTEASEWVFPLSGVVFTY